MSLRLGFLISPETTTREPMAETGHSTNIRTGFLIINGGDADDGEYCTGCVCRDKWLGETFAVTLRQLRCYAREEQHMREEGRHLQPISTELFATRVQYMITTRVRQK